MTPLSSTTSAGIYYVIGTVGGIIVFILIVVVLVLTGCIMIKRQNKSQTSCNFMIWLYNDYLIIIIKCVMFTSHTVIIPYEEIVTPSTSISVVTTSSQYHSKSV